MTQASFRRDLLQALIDNELRRLRNYERIVEGALHKEKQDLKAEVDLAATKLPQEQREEFRDRHADTYQELSRIYPDILRSSLLRMYCSFFENYLTLLYKEYKRYYNCPYEIDEQKGSQIEKIQKCMKKAGIRFPDQTAEWNSIKHDFYIRHTVIHNGGKLNKEKKTYPQTKKFIQNNSFLTLDQLEYIHFDRSFVGEVAENMEIFFDNLFKTLPTPGYY